jgi:hypothetical protein
MSVDPTCGVRRGSVAVAAALYVLASAATLAPFAGAPALAADAAPASTAAATDAAPAPAAAPDDLSRRIADLERQLAALRDEVARARAGAADPDLEKKIDALSREVERLKLGAAAAPVAKESVGGLGPAASKVYAARPGVTIGGYGEMLYVDPSGTRDDGQPSGEEATADLLRAVLYFGYKFDDRLLFNSEVEFEHAVAGDGEPGEVAVEFAYIDFRWRPALGVRGGLLLVPVGFINELHEPPIFLGAQRPEVEQFIIPTTWSELGGGVYGEAGPVSWKAYLVTSLDAAGFSAEQGIREGRQEGAQVQAADLALTARVDWVPVRGLLLGASGFTGDAQQGNPGLDGARLTQWEAHAEWRAHGVQVRALFARTRLDHADEVSALVGETVGSQMDGSYAEAGYNVLARRRSGSQELMPFVRYEAFDTQAEVASGAGSDPANDRTVRTYGVRWRPIPGIALKADWQDLGDGADTGVDRFNLALGWLF